MKEILVPPLKIQGIKTKLVPWICKNIGQNILRGRWIEPFMGSGVVGFNVPYSNMLLCDANRHVINFYEWLRDVNVVLAINKLRKMGNILATDESYYYKVRKEYNVKPDPLKLLFLSRTCFNGIMRFSLKGNFNTPFCKNPNKFTPELLDSLLVSLSRTRQTIKDGNIQFFCGDWQQSVGMAKPDDFIYCDPPYSGRETGYIGAWALKDDLALMEALQGKRYMVSSWFSDGKGVNPVIAEWEKRGAHILQREHRYMVGPKGGMRPKVIEALIINPGINQG